MFFRFQAPKSDKIKGPSQANFEATLAYFLYLTEIFRILKAKTSEFVLNQQNSLPNSAKFWSLQSKLKKLCKLRDLLVESRFFT